MPIKVAELTEMQAAHISTYAQEWTAVGVSTEPAQRQEAEMWISAAHRQAGMEAPKFVWCSSPREAVRQINHHFRNVPWTSVAPAFQFFRGYTIYGTTWNALREVIAPGIWEQVQSAMQDTVRAGVRSRVWSAIWDGVDAAIRNEEWGKAMYHIGFPITQTGCGQFNADLFALCAFFREACNLTQETDAIFPWMQAARFCGWWIPAGDVCFVIERHRDIKFDRTGRMHAEDGPALIYDDGFSIYAWHGVRVPQVVVMEPKSITVTMIQEQNNPEVRRVMMKRYGVQRYMIDAGAEVIDESEHGILYRLDSPTQREPLVMVCIKNTLPDANGKFRCAMVRVPPRTRTALEAVAWSFGLSPDEYQPVMET